MVTVLMVLVLIFMGAKQTALGSEKKLSTPAIICKVFGSYCRQAQRVSWCESRWSIWARNGQYLGLFQMGSYARHKYGHGYNAWAQALAARRYFIDSGRDWSPWSCKP